MALEERDKPSGYMTTGHEWNGIKELNSPVPRLVFFFLWLTFAIAVIGWVLLPAWPLGLTYTKGLLGMSQRKTLAASIQAAAPDVASWTSRIKALDYPAIQADPKLMLAVRQTGHTLFADNCAACHGSQGKGQPGFPNLVAGAWLWGGDPASIAQTSRVGINSVHPDSRVSQMQAYGTQDVLKKSQIESVAAYVLSLSRPDQDPAQVAAGQPIFAANCVACHGDNGKGNLELGAPNLTDEVWLYGGDNASIVTTIDKGRQGHMPAWEARLSEVQRKILALYVVDLGAKSK